MLCLQDYNYCRYTDHEKLNGSFAHSFAESDITDGLGAVKVYAGQADRSVIDLDCLTPQAESHVISICTIPTENGNATTEILFKIAERTLISLARQMY